MFVLYETPAGYAIFKVLDESKVKEVENLYLEFESPDLASKIVKLKHFEKFKDTTEALSATTAAVEGTLCKSLKKTLKKLVIDDVQNTLLVADARLGSAIRQKLAITCVSDTNVTELMRCIRTQSESLLSSLPKQETRAMALGLAHSLARYKLKFSPDKVDTMIIQAQCLLDELDKELNNYMMRAKEWYGWHFPELHKIVKDNVEYIKILKLVGSRDHMADTDLSDILSEELETQVKDAAETSMGTEMNETDINHIQLLCQEILELNDYRSHLAGYIKKRMVAIAPNVAVLVGETIGARLIAHTGSLVNLAKQPASTIQILGAEKALFRALKTKKHTPKYGLIYHAPLVAQANKNFKGKISRSLAAKVALATRFDAFGEALTAADDEAIDVETKCQLGITHRAKVEARLQLLQNGNLKRLSGTGKAKSKFEKYQATSEIKTYPTELDSSLPSGSAIGKKRKFPEGATPKKPLIEEIKQEGEEEQSAIDTSTKSKKKKKDRSSTTAVQEEEEPQQAAEDDDAGEGSAKKKNKKKAKRQGDYEEAANADDSIVQQDESVSKKKKKKKSKQESDE